jgi:hypothetical protein
MLSPHPARRLAWLGARDADRLAEKSSAGREPLPRSLALDVTGISQALAKRGEVLAVRFERCEVKKPTTGIAGSSARADMPAESNTRNGYRAVPLAQSHGDVA